ncbi:MAG: MoaD/ThiS family protein [Spirochaetes bacterium]|nr:MoaD/ThiS family protein [Spirochaetota bacterium]
MVVTIKLFASLQKGRFEVKEFTVDKPLTVDDIRKMLKISKNEKLVILINGKHAELHHKLKDKDVIAIFPQIGGG